MVPTTALTSGKYASNIAAYDGYLYVLGGYDGTTYHSDADSAPINNNGTIGNWNTSGTFTTGRSLASSAVYNGDIYIIGGYESASNTSCKASGTSNYCSDVQYAGVQSIPRVGYYSTLIDNGVNVDPLKLVTDGSQTNNPGFGVSGPGGIVVTYKYADNSCTSFTSGSSLYILTGPIA